MTCVNDHYRLLTYDINTVFAVYIYVCNVDIDFSLNIYAYMLYNYVLR